MLERTEAGTRPIRLLGVSVHGFSSEPAAPRVAVTPRISGSFHARLPFDADPDGDGDGDSDADSHAESDGDSHDENGPGDS
jgi:hypothetical protein